MIWRFRTGKWFRCRRLDAGKLTVTDQVVINVMMSLLQKMASRRNTLCFLIPTVTLSTFSLAMLWATTDSVVLDDPNPIELVRIPFLNLSLSSRYKPARCLPKQNILFLKVHKCASTTISNIIVRYGLKHGLKFALPKREDGHIGWPLSLRPTMVLPSEEKPNILAHHIVFNATSVAKIMPNDTIYLATVREPFSQFKSTVNFFYNVEMQQLGFKTGDYVSEFLSNPSKYERNIKFYWGHRYFGERSITKNCIAREFGYDPSQFLVTPNKMASFADKLDGIFDLVMIKEYYFESVVLMKRKLCWSLEDMISNHLNSNPENRNRVTQEKVKNLMETYRNWSKIDYVLYERFLVIFRRKIRETGPGFHKEVSLLKYLNQVVTQHCGKASNVHLLVPETEFSQKFLVTPQLCDMLKVGPHDLTQSLIRQQYGLVKQIGYFIKYHIFNVSV
ncbi:galactose-3-O-sulfotransferase 2-like [Lineus longissimus]|uniref:galactose-3-O-sulfotransferase 2-like n=1 Tax=Lineus longissimus TaxID=88925 RepID=UPI00315CBB5F